VRVLPTLSVETTESAAGAVVLALVKAYAFEVAGEAVAVFAVPVKPVAETAGKAIEATPERSVAVTPTVKSPAATGL
jgi:hypothetical protein